MGREGKGAGVRGRGMGWEGRGGKGRREQGRGGEYRHFFLYTLSTGYTLCNGQKDTTVYAWQCIHLSIPLCINLSISVFC